MESEDQQIDLLEKIDRYLAGKLAGEERSVFEEQMRNDPELAYEVNLHKTINFSIANKDKQALKDHLVNVNHALSEIRQSTQVDYGDEKKHGKVIRMYPDAWKYISVAVMIAILAVPSYFFFFSGPDAKGLYAEYYSAYPVSRGAIDDERLSDASTLYSNGNYSEAVSLLDNMIKESPQQAEYYFYRGISFLAAKGYPESIADLEKYREMGGTYKDDATWYLALAYLMQRDFEATKLLLDDLQNSKTYRDKADEISEKMK